MHFDIVAHSLALVLVAGLALPAGAIPPTSGPAGPAPTVGAADTVKAQVARALELIKTEKYDAAIALLDSVILTRPDLLKVRLLRAKALAKNGNLDRAEVDLQAVQKVSPDLPACKTLAQLIADARASQTVVMVGSNKYSEWERFWKIDGKTAFTLAAFKAPEGVTAFYFPARPSDAAELEPWRAEADAEIFFLRAVLLKGAADQADLALPGATEHKVDQVPFLILVDAEGKELARGTPDACKEKLEAVRKEAKERIAARAPKRASQAEPIAKEDFSTSDAPIESIAASGWTNIIMVTSPG